MRAVNFVKRLHWELPGTVCRHGLTIGDVDNDCDNELVVGTAEGELYIFKGLELWQKIAGLGLITSIAIGDIFNYGRNALVVICGDGWTHIFYSPRSVNPNNKQEHEQDNFKASIDRVVRSYRWSSNADLGTGKLVGLNKWECTNQIGTVTLQHTGDGTSTLLVAQPGGTFMRIKCKSEGCHTKDCSCEAVDYQTLGISRMRNPNISTDIIGDLEPGRTSFISTLEPKLPNYMSKNKLSKQSFADDSQLDIKTFKATSLEFRRNYSQPVIRKSSLDMTDEYVTEFAIRSQETGKFYTPVDSSSTDEVDGNFIGSKVILGKFDKNVAKETLPPFKNFLCNNNNKHSITNNNKNNSNNNSNTCIAEACTSNNRNSINTTTAKHEKQDKKTDDTITDEKDSKKGKPYALATLDGTIMLVQDEVILWAMQVDHQIFALCRLDVTGDKSDEIIACAWDGQTYILDQHRCSVRFQFEEPVRAFCTGNYSVTPGASTPSLVYNTFNNKIFLYYDVTLPSMTINPLDPTKTFEPDEVQVLKKLLGECSISEKQQKIKQLTEWLLYSVDND
ncbi:integrin-alpha FG-GAP repeat-containing protein 2-like isoform X2 [Pseudomyrmex gracilis]|uniref:integrin-alpha FG-GAP repeat-containing protein 2-like isoform X2 n=1 Tax=Pseudomyrmex gracilis TaxID=219809 RepID=UPI000995BF36|nr:integrin-alpha FG-GAP repeat-containing protein 2-like isoform X2 [Pseudomyrmex gracilis]